jgi:hypothetical protein
MAVVWSLAMAGVSSALWLLDLLPGGCPWWPAAKGTDSSDVSLNKLMCCLSIWGLHALLLLLAGHGGEEKKLNGEVTCRSGGWRGRSLLQDGVYHMVALFRRHDLRLIRQLLQMLTLASIQPPRRRPFDGSSTASIALSLPSGFVPSDGEGGRRWSSRCPGGEEEGPDCFSVLFFRVLCAKFQDYDVIFVLYWSCLQVVSPPTIISMQH